MIHRNIKTKIDLKLSLSSLHNFKKVLEQKRDSIPQVAANIANRLAEEIQKKSYDGTYIESATPTSNGVVAKVRNDNSDYTYKEFGTGIVGSSNSHPIAQNNNWIYDVNEHGEKGWVYMSKDGTFRWTKGVQAEKKFYNAIRSAKRKLRSIAIEEFRKIGGNI